MLSLLRNRRAGLSAVEYALLLVLIVVVGITAWQTLGNPLH